MSKATERAGLPQTPPPALGALFLSGSLALDLVNTEMVVRGKKRDVLSSPDALAGWWEAACKQHPDLELVTGAGASVVWTSELLDAIKALRGALRTLSTHVVEQWTVEEEDLQPINAILAQGYSAIERTSQGTVKAVIQLRNPEQDGALFPIALSALRLFTGSDWQRLHKCKNDRCVLFFYDATRSGTRLWCSLGCMDRARSIQRYQRTKNQATHR
jgi:predicted RNA-binding Zn ribbon-like protein